MISADEKGNIVVDTGGKTYTLNSNASYLEFLLWITSPDPKQVITDDAFEIAQDAPVESRELLTRYSSFLQTFARKREALIQTPSTIDFSQREAEIEGLIRRLSEDKSS